ncbi:MAG: HEAT repeat domain-containing protein [Planctomycetes bacterium]|nr:HEAT repeat domain-containing protein [Planctomycetota bacterium]
MRWSVTRSSPFAWIVTALIALGDSALAPAQDPGANLAEHARAARDSALATAEREAHARAFVEAARPEDWPLAFEILREVADRRDRLENELAEARRPVTTQWIPEDTTSFGLFADRDRLELDRSEERRSIQAALRAEEAVLAVFRASLTHAATRSDPEAFADFVARQARVREPAELAPALRALGFFPTPAARRLAVDHLDDADFRVGLAAARACEEHARAFTAPTPADPLWPEAFERLQSGLARAWRDRDAQHGRYRGLARKSAAVLGKISVTMAGIMTEAAKLLEDVLSGKGIARQPRKKTAALPSGKKLGGELAEALRAHEATGRELRAQDRRIGAMLTATSRIFDCLTAEQRAPFEARLAQRLASAAHQPDSHRLIELCGHLRSEAVGHALLLATSAAAAEVRVAACLALGKHARPEHALSLGARLEDSHWQVEVAAIHALSAIGGREAVDVLVTAVGLSVGRVREEAGRALHRLTGESFEQDALGWKPWWDRNREQYRGPVPRSETASPAASPEAAAAGVACFGIRTHSRRIAFLLDTSAAMALRMGSVALVVHPRGSDADPTGRRMHCVLRATSEALATLPEDTAFNILLFGDKVSAWKPDLVPAQARNREAAQKWLTRVQPSGGAAVFDALVRAFDPAGRETSAPLRATAADTFFVVMGSPASGGALALETDIVEEIERINRLEQVAIHTVAVGGSAPLGFLRALAARCGGRFVMLPADGGER